MPDANVTKTDTTANRSNQIASMLAEIAIVYQIGSFAELVTDHWPRRFKAKSDSREIVIAYPNCTQQIADIVKLANRVGITLCALGEASSVVGCFDLAAELYVSTRDLNTFGELNPVACHITVGAGVNGGDLKALLDQKGFELGQYPQSLYMSSVGGWVNTRAAGALSTYYGGIADAVIGLEAVLANGEILKIEPRPHPSGGIDPISVLIGSEGSLAIVSSVTLQVFRALPTTMLCAGFSSFQSSIEAQRQLVQSGFPVGLLRAYNAAETTAIAPAAVAERGKTFSLLNFTLIAPAQSLSTLQREAVSLIETLGGWTLPADAAQGWFMHRFDVADMMEKRNSGAGQMFDTCEVALPWDRTSSCVDQLEEALLGKVSKLFAHFSHAYQTGACLYAIFWIDEETDTKALESWSDVWTTITQIAIENGGTLSHHHGIGSVRAMRYSESSSGKFHAKIKAALDPQAILSARLLAG